MGRPCRRLGAGPPAPRGLARPLRALLATGSPRRDRPSAGGPSGVGAGRDHQQECRLRWRRARRRRDVTFSPDEIWGCGKSDSGEEDDEEEDNEDAALALEDGQEDDVADEKAAADENGAAGDGIIDDSFAGDLVLDPEDDFAWPPVVEGCALREEDYREAGKSYHRLIVTCKYHSGCFKKRNTGAAQCAALGRLEPLAFLACWVRGGAHRNADKHGDFKPKIGQQREWLETYSAGAS